MVRVANSPYTGLGFTVAPDAILDDFDLGITPVGFVTRPGELSVIVPA